MMKTVKEIYADILAVKPTVSKFPQTEEEHNLAAMSVHAERLAIIEMALNDARQEYPARPLREVIDGGHFFFWIKVKDIYDIADYNEEHNEINFKTEPYDSSWADAEQYMDCLAIPIHDPNKKATP